MSDEMQAAIDEFAAIPLGLALLASPTTDWGDWSSPTTDNFGVPFDSLPAHRARSTKCFSRGHHMFHGACTTCGWDGVTP